MNSQSLSLSSAIRMIESGSRCEFDVLLSNEDRFVPSVIATDIQGQKFFHSETFIVERNELKETPTFTQPGLLETTLTRTV